MATRVSTNSDAEKKRTPNPSKSAMAPMSSSQVAMFQLKDVGNRSNGNGKRSAISANQL